MQQQDTQDRNSYNEETHTESDRTNERKYDESATGRDRPGGDGDVGTEQVNAIDRDDSGKPTGQDHSTERHDLEQPTGGVGAVQDSNLIGSDIADISE
jgi:hypothetical protein